MKNQQRLIVGLVLALIVIIFALLNGQPVAVNFFGAAFQWPLIVVIVVCLLLGALVTLLVSTASLAKTHKQLKALEAENQQLTQAQEDAIATATKQASEEIASLKAQLAAKAETSAPTPDESK
ncbi:LapA family protein [Lacticaseibacillus daqingensis]|uniref:LapA family protein n=1 Tax=Lacticaseibacillus daqingensis TaxID=2486014 RepID=UPI000F76C73A|nr:lipopolysaccharide assembly protein LapA domain-containing protein [Lacticaseibacillus daqingensis]